MAVVDTDPSYGLRFAADAFERLGLGERWCYYDAHTATWLGPLAARVHDVCGSAELLLNLSGVNPLRPWLAKVTRDPWSYQEFIRGSKAEWSVAKHGYVASRSGWFSERSAAYLASGRPVLTQQTGFSHWLPTGAGLLAFETIEEALAGMEKIDANYEHHCRATRELAETFFDAGMVLTSLIERAFDSSK